MNKVLDKIKMKYLKDREFKKEFDKDKEKAIEKHFGKSFLKSIKGSVGTDLSERSIQSFLNSKNKEELDDNVLEVIAGGKKKETETRNIEIRVPVIEEEKVNDIKMTPTVKGTVNVVKGMFNDF